MSGSAVVALGEMNGGVRPDELAEEGEIPVAEILRLSEFMWQSQRSQFECHGRAAQSLSEPLASRARRVLRDLDRVRQLSASGEVGQLSSSWELHGVYFGILYSAFGALWCG